MSSGPATQELGNAYCLYGISVITDDGTFTCTDIDFGRLQQFEQADRDGQLRCVLTADKREMGLEIVSNDEAGRLVLDRQS